MPELPEVESVRRGLAEWLPGARVDAVRLYDPRILGTASQRIIAPAAAEAFATGITGAAFDVPARRGKFLWVPLADHRRALSVHLGMSGQFRIHEPGDPLHRHTRADFACFAPSGREFSLRFVDQRIFGHLGIDELTVPAQWNSHLPVPAQMAHIAPDPLEASTDLEAIARVVKTKRSAIKSVLLDQSVLSGIGNIYADEALYRARVHPLAQAARLRISRVRAVLESAREVMLEALAQGGTSFDALYVNVNGESGYFDRSLGVYGRTGQPCLRCGTLITRLVVGGRGTHICLQCQKPQR
ncbi:bifunctional DNA-formamidopyrimidine glycosylase/DNA-(apurinic or apyrimidinic site) lyase [Brevibacterium otitidis]|uniref:Formamidopyrimidine-DNA glycosylase n=1 Tax=Brevibacterium otitidis TaxID=53364 RepID=A0ABV5X3S1_9MICO|nr:bifunctional DNA-formamidopyrimidine glycosylase/DNA-(apurinic or apyrimidinic site) lyase [Brevibacterium otitidis]